MQRTDTMRNLSEVLFNEKENIVDVHQYQFSRTDTSSEYYIKWIGQLEYLQYNLQYLQYNLVIYAN